MRSCLSVVTCFLLLIIGANAAPLPLTVNEISLMLRTGYSNPALIKELGVRHFADTLDAAKETTLVKAGANADLIAALKSGTYSLSPGQIATIQGQIADQTKRRAEQAAVAQKSDAAYREQVVRERSAKSAPKPEAIGDNIAQLLKSDLVQLRNGSVTHVDETALANKKLIALYFSAHWCGPCRKFTPQLVDYYNRVAPQHPEFEIVFFSRDKSQSGFETYLRETNMPWLAIDFAKLRDKEVLAQHAGNGIPSLVLVDSTGKMLSSCYDGSRYLGPQKVLADLDNIFAGKEPRVASAQ